jgi:zinc transport system substrate-binding protein
MKKILLAILITAILFSTAFSFEIITSIKPIALIAKSVVGTNCSVSYIMTPYTNPHTFQLKPSDIIKMERADLIILVGSNFESWCGKVEEKFSEKTIVLQKGILSAIIKKNPHFWTDPIYVGYLADLLYCNLTSNLRKKTESSYIKFKINLTKESKKILKMTESVKNKHFIAVHPAFFYILNRYGFEVRSVADGGTSSVSSREIIELLKYSNKNNIKNIYAVEGLSIKLAQPLINSSKLKLVSIDFLSRNYNDYISYLDNIAKSLFGENQ